MALVDRPSWVYSFLFFPHVCVCVCVYGSVRPMFVHATYVTNAYKAPCPTMHGNKRFFDLNPFCFLSRSSLLVRMLECWMRHSHCLCRRCYSTTVLALVGAVLKRP